MAKLLNLPKYYTGVPCKNGHLAERYTQSAVCQDCVNGDRTHKFPTQIENLKHKSETLKTKASDLNIYAVKSYAEAVEKASRDYQMILSNASLMHKQAESCDQQILEIENFSVKQVQLRIDAEKTLADKQRVVNARRLLQPQRVFMLADKKEYVESLLLEIMQRRCPELTLEDLRYRGKCEGGVLYTIKVFAQDIPEVLRICNELYKTPPTRSAPPATIPTPPAQARKFAEAMGAPMS